MKDRASVPRKELYHLPPSENLKFDSFLDLMLNDSKLPKPQIKEEIKSYVQALETNYNDTIRSLKEKNEKLLK